MAVLRTAYSRADVPTRITRCVAPGCDGPVPAGGHRSTCSRACTLRLVGLPPEFDPARRTDTGRWQWTEWSRAVEATVFTRLLSTPAHPVRPRHARVCLYGHPLTTENVRVDAKTGYRRCRTCHRLAARQQSRRRWQQYTRQRAAQREPRP